ncbi:MAG: hypothetical protein LH624_04605 [Cryobacterium sp.]|nr:hypothetical protein [Cryobacterium sp.]
MTGLPLAQLLIPPDGPAPFWVGTTADHSGRLADRSPLRYLGWAAGTAVKVRVHEASVVSVVLGNTSHTVTAQGYLRLPLAIRRRCRIDVGARLLVAAWSDPSQLIICTSSVLAALLGDWCHIPVDSEVRCDRRPA